MTFSVNFLERREGGSPSIERVFRSVAEYLGRDGVAIQFTQAPYGNSFFAILGNLLRFRPDGADILHITGQISYMILVLPPRKTVLTIHDLTILDLRTGFRRWLIKWLTIILPARRAKFLTVISAATMERLVNVSGIPADRVTVIDNPLLVTRSASRAFNASKPTILQLGTAPNKNVERLMEALTDISCRLRIVGRLDPQQKARLDGLGLDWSNHPELDDAGVEAAYEDADIVTLCSTDEGFGLPIIEAQAKGKIVVTSNRSPMKEVAGSGAILVDPESVESIRRGISEAISSPDLRERLISEGRKNIERFDPAAIANGYRAVYEKVLKADQGL